MGTLRDKRKGSKHNVDFWYEEKDVREKIRKVEDDLKASVHGWINLNKQEIRFSISDILKIHFGEELVEASS